MQLRDYGKKQETIVTKTQSTSENTNSNTKTSTVNAINTHLPTMTLNISCFNFLIKRHRLAEWTKKQKSIYLLSIKNNLSFKDIVQPQSKRMGKSISIKWDQEASRCAILMSDEVDSKLELTRRDKERHSYQSREQLTQEDNTILNIYVLNSGTHNFIEFILLELNIQVHRLASIH